jgi:hypothetical protein
MEIHSLRVLVTDADLSALATRLAPDVEKIEGLQARLTPAGVELRGEYPTGFGFKVPFETLWQVAGAGPELRVGLAEIKVAGLPAGILRGALLRMLRDAAEGRPGVRMEGESLRIDLAEAAGAQGIIFRVNLTGVTFDSGTMVVEAG